MRDLVNASIFYDVYSFKEHIDAIKKINPMNAHKRLGVKSRNYNNIVMTSGGFDPIHIGHLKCIQESAKIAGDNVFVVIVNGDSFLKEKKGYSFMTIDERVEIISAIKGVDYVVVHEKPGDMTVCEPIEVLKPMLFTKGGDRNSFENVPESKVCMDVGCRVVFDVGGDKIQSSSELVNEAKKKKG
ncbi:MAG: adenylyltransferase/cytidyltransferase family protein [Candidatus Hodarchaeales archaeon]|jgi:D-beta-D-heptose 7-phosphate kinase/D-beta-D-heptose 1-phosphate adenosyltransferase